MRTTTQRKPARQHDGQLTPGHPSRELEGDGLPADTELLVENHGILQGRFRPSSSAWSPWPSPTRSARRSAQAAR